MDERDFHPRWVHTILRNPWILRDCFYVMRKDGKFYVLYFENDQEREYIQVNSLWAIQGALMHFANWRPNIRLYYLHIETIPIWVRIWGFPLESYSIDLIEYLVVMIGPIEYVENMNQYRLLEFITVH